MTNLWTLLRKLKYFVNNYKTFLKIYSVFNVQKYRLFRVVSDNFRLQEKYPNFTCFLVFFTIFVDFVMHYTSTQYAPVTLLNSCQPGSPGICQDQYQCTCRVGRWTHSARCKFSGITLSLGNIHITLVKRKAEHFHLCIVLL